MKKKKSGARRSVAHESVTQLLSIIGPLSALMPEPQTRLERVVCALVSSGSWNESAAPSLVKFAREVCAEMNRRDATGELTFPTFDPAHIIMTRTQFEAALRAALRDDGNDYCHWDEYPSKVEELTAHVCKYLEKCVNE